MQYMPMWGELGVLKVGGLLCGLLLCGIQLCGVTFPVQFPSDSIKGIFGVWSTGSCLVVWWSRN